MPCHPPPRVLRGHPPHAKSRPAVDRRHVASRRAFNHRSLSREKIRPDEFDPGGATPVLERRPVIGALDGRRPSDVLHSSWLPSWASPIVCDLRPARRRGYDWSRSLPLELKSATSNKQGSKVTDLAAKSPTSEKRPDNAVSAFPGPFGLVAFPAGPIAPILVKMVMCPATPIQNLMRSSVSLTVAPRWC